MFIGYFNDQIMDWGRTVVTFEIFKFRFNVKKKKIHSRSKHNIVEQSQRNVLTLNENFYCKVMPRRILKKSHLWENHPYWNSTAADLNLNYHSEIIIRPFNYGNLNCRKFLTFFPLIKKKPPCLSPNIKKITI